MSLLAPDVQARLKAEARAFALNQLGLDPAKKLTALEKDAVDEIANPKYVALRRAHIGDAVAK